MAKIEPNMLCLVKKDGEVRGMVKTIRKQTEADSGLPPTASVGWLVEALSSMRAERIASVLGRVFKIDEMQMAPGTEGWCSECYLFPLPGLDDESERDTETPKVEEKEHDLVL